MIYLDNNATTPLDPRVWTALRPWLETHFANPSSGSAAAREAQRALEHARAQVATLLGCQPAEIIFTSGGTEANHAAIHSATQLFPQRKHLITAATEHAAILAPLARLEAHSGYELTRLPVNAQGEISLDELAAAIRPDTALVTLMWANNETGVVHPVVEAAALAAAHDVLFHTDAVQAVGKWPISLHDTSVHTLALSGHKVHGPKGLGALYVNRRSGYEPWLLGGGQEQGRRAGTENVAAIVGLGQAAELALVADSSPLRDDFETALQQALPDVIFHGAETRRLPNTSHFQIPGTVAEGMMILLEKQGIIVSAGSACHTGALHPSHVLAAMGLDATAARASLRVSFGRQNTPQEMSLAVTALTAAAHKMRGLW